MAMTLKDLAIASALMIVAATQVSAARLPFPGQAAETDTAEVVVIQDTKSHLVTKYAAARAAQKVVPGKLLDVQLSKRGDPVYLVKVRDDERVRIIVVDARTGQVVGY
ncbi:putative membrane protein YkoI [Rhodoligotrophos appendicifer]|uniref:PepSY domain-containing protein n=1 Tax=Rhodoligotrophos appendicifer TaxID=987056 RepID=UPI0011864270|nr:PepSY domain-containing protein [Rhodoligotrophos appendicifer]